MQLCSLGFNQNSVSLDISHAVQNWDISELCSTVTHAFLSFEESPLLSIKKKSIPFLLFIFHPSSWELTVTYMVLSPFILITTPWGRLDWRIVTQGHYSDQIHPFIPKWEFEPRSLLGWFHKCYTTLRVKKNPALTDNVSHRPQEQLLQKYLQSRQEAHSHKCTWIPSHICWHHHNLPFSDSWQ